MDIEIIHYGARDGVTGSCHELRIDSSIGILIDCGLFQGAETSPGGASSDRLEIDFPSGFIEALVYTHVHIDHVGRVTYLLAAGFDGPIYCSEPSVLLLLLVLEDSLRVGVTRDRDLIARVIDRLRKQSVRLPYKHWRNLSLDGDATLAIRLQRAVQHALEGGDTVLIPAFQHWPHPRIVERVGADDTSQPRSDSRQTRLGRVGNRARFTVGRALYRGLSRTPSVLGSRVETTPCSGPAPPELREVDHHRR